MKHTSEDSDTSTNSDALTVQTSAYGAPVFGQASSTFTLKFSSEVELSRYVFMDADLRYLSGLDARRSGEFFPDERVAISPLLVGVGSASAFSARAPDGGRRRRKLYRKIRIEYRPQSPYFPRTRR
jgi:hypothetical protein